jgi:ParB-like chromosome segregation protein Spo0J
MNSFLVPIGNVKTNPNNPRFIKDEKFKKLVKSIKTFPKMLELRPIVVNDDMTVLGGNMRLKASKEAGLKEVHVVKASNFTEAEQKEFIIKDNVGFGEWDWDIISNEWDTEEVEEWGLDLPIFEDDIEEPKYDELTAENNNKPPIIKITFKNEKDLQDAEEEIAKIVSKYEKAFYSVSAGEL